MLRDKDRMANPGHSFSYLFFFIFLLTNGNVNGNVNQPHPSRALSAPTCKINKYTLKVYYTKKSIVQKVWLYINHASMSHIRKAHAKYIN